MHREIAFEVPGPIKGKARARTTRTGITYTPKETVQYENLVKVCFREAQEISGVTFEDEPVAAVLDVYYEIPKSTTKKNCALMLLNKLLPTKKPDVDNIAKIVLDSLNGIAYRDDVQVVQLQVNKYYSKRGKPYVSVRLMQVQEGEEP